ncbi:lytic transglycosylase domain-containing protein [Corynebacterium pacaense]|uniref:lytic transglycosylase domain-containing protein n=1 Tax=Corynebacterium pacaense TaxID=1816684 RepID=UPI0009BA046C|nr:lytic murein transglycosylase [Corynebacterium pacaense]
MNSGASKAFGCGCGSVLAVIMVISFVGWALSFIDGGAPIRQLEPIPDDVPPARGEAVPVVDIHAPGRTSSQLDFWAQPIAADISVSAQAVAAYGNAELVAEGTWPGCHISWNTLAGIGHVETRHGTYSGKLFGGSALNADGVATPPIIGIPLDGSPGVAEIPDTDGGALDGDPDFDRAVGPMQFIPESWGRFGLDANGDGVADPNQIDDAALSAAHLLCENGGDLSTPEGWTRAVHSYNMSTKYLLDVRDAAAAFALRQPAL